MEFGWDEAKRRSNLIKHGVSFNAAIVAFLDPKRLVNEDRKADYGEVRFNMLAVFNGRIHHITYTSRDGQVRLISARKANKREQKRYGNG
jgi:uncharacterized protein